MRWRDKPQQSCEVYKLYDTDAVSTAFIALAGGQSSFISQPCAVESDFILILMTSHSNDFMRSVQDLKANTGRQLFSILINADTFGLKPKVYRA